MRGKIERLLGQLELEIGSSSDRHLLVGDDVMAMQFARSLLRIVLADDPKRQELIIRRPLGWGYKDVKFDTLVPVQTIVTEGDQNNG